jgi:hypothetical protein
MDLGQILSLIVALIGVAGGVLVAAFTARFGLKNYQQQKKFDRDTELRRERGTAYNNYLNAYTEAQRWRGVEGKEEKFTEVLQAYSQAYNALFPIAKSEVLLAITKFHEHTWLEGDNSFKEVAWLEPSLAQKKWDKWVTTWKQLYASMILEIRIDAFDASGLSVASLAERLPWYFDWGADQKAQAPPAELASLPVESAAQSSDVSG